MVFDKDLSVRYALDEVSSLLKKIDNNESCGADELACFILLQDVFDKYESKLNWDLISYNKSLPLTESFINKYYDKWNWSNLSTNQSLPLTYNFISKFNGKWNWQNLIQNENLQYWNHLQM